MPHAILRHDKGHNLRGYCHIPGDAERCEVCDAPVPRGFHVCYDCDIEYDLKEWCNIPRAKAG